MAVAVYSSFEATSSLITGAIWIGFCKGLPSFGSGPVGISGSYNSPSDTSDTLC
jgi:hypothetical protein